MAASFPISIVHVRASTDFGSVEKIILSLCRKVDSNHFHSSIYTSQPADTAANALSVQANSARIQCQCNSYLNRFSVESIKTFLKYIEDNDIQLIHSHGYRENIMALFAKYLKRTKIVATVHGWTAGQLRKAIDLRVLRCFDRVIAVAPNFADNLYRKGDQVDRVDLIPNFVDVNEFQKKHVSTSLKAKLKLDGTKIIVGTAGRLSPEKGMSDLLIAAKQVASNHPDVIFLIAGEGPEESDLRKKTIDLGLASSVSFVGYQDNMVDFLNLIDIYVSPSLSEGLPRSILEAAATERPIVATDVGGVGQIVKSGDTGILVPAKHPFLLAEGIEQLIADQQYGSKIGRRARNRVVGEFSEDTIIEIIESVYESVFN